MRRIGTTIAAAAVLVAGAIPFVVQAQGRGGNQEPQITRQMRDQGMQGAPAAVQEAKLNCTVSDAYLINSVTDRQTRATTAFYEVACQEGIGYIVQSGGEDGTRGFDCLSMYEVANAPGAQPGTITCRLPANANPKQTLGPIARAAGRACEVTDARAMGANPAGDAFFEVACQEGSGYVLQTSFGKAPVAMDCTQFLGGDTQCQLTTREQIVAKIGGLVTGSGQQCTASDVRYVGVAGDDTFYEVACGAERGFMVQTNATGAVERTIDCTRAQNIAGGCTLVDVALGEQEEAATYTRLAQANNFPCEVSKYRFLGLDQRTDSEVVELACSNRPDGAIAMFPAQAGGTARVFDCIQGASLGVTCQLTEPNGAFAKYTAGLASQGRTTCQVSNAKYLASTAAGTDLIETACADGDPGYVMSVDHDSGTVRELFTCREANALGAACTFPTNQIAAR